MKMASQEKIGPHSALYTVTKTKQNFNLTPKSVVQLKYRAKFGPKWSMNVQFKMSKCKSGQNGYFANIIDWNKKIGRIQLLWQPSCSYELLKVLCGGIQWLLVKKECLTDPSVNLTCSSVYCKNGIPDHWQRHKVKAFLMFFDTQRCSHFAPAL